MSEIIGGGMLISRDQLGKQVPIRDSRLEVEYPDDGRAEEDGDGVEGSAWVDEEAVLIIPFSGVLSRTSS